MQDGYRGALGIPSIARKDKRSQVQPDWIISPSFRHTPVTEPKTPVSEPKRNLLIHRSDAAKACRATARARPKEPYAPLVSLTVKRQNGA